ncbi:hypothetical protein GR160_14765 [Flavobacterium sp. Sd200]|uniref:hypothetical protein n=1 Tax=Flavobacterium sp. Sd200 TaxID=2692211 RepID=UPI001368A26B|nr:hypothetical protein [Flavobacterium sp. Sd200]MXN92489.1 hypothetical protein [Flavobacterium sp. Sd200]
MKTISKPINDSPLSMPASLPKPDLSGTSPNRYANSAGTLKKDEGRKKPDNHTSSHERMINPDRGENN